MVETLDKKTDLIYSEDDGGWYLQYFSIDLKDREKISRIYKTRIQAIEAWEKDKITWKKP